MDPRLERGKGNPVTASGRRQLHGIQQASEMLPGNRPVQNHRRIFAAELLFPGRKGSDPGNHSMEELTLSARILQGIFPGICSPKADSDLLQTRLEQGGDPGIREQSTVG